MLKFLFLFSFLIIFYSYIGYGILIFLLVKIKRLFTSGKLPVPGNDWEPEVTLLVAAHNEAGLIEEKILNSLALDYPSGKLKWIFITDGSTDQTTEIIRRYQTIILLHEPERRGKAAALNRAMGHVKTPYVIFCDANTLLNPGAVRELVKHYGDPKVGGVAGEKKIVAKRKDEAAGAGEGIYWKYESLLKKLDSELYTVVGAAGELFSMKTSLYTALPVNTIIEDFVQSLLICKSGQVLRYEPGAYALETASANMTEEHKRKVRIAAGAFQAMKILKSLFNVFRYPVLSFQFISHRILRWTLCPVCLVLLLITSILLAYREGPGIYTIVVLLECFFYALAVVGWLLARRNISVQVLYIPYYFLFMNLSVFQGFYRYISNRQPVNWEKSVRKSF